MKPECESKLRLISTAHDLIWRSSYGSVSVDDICEKADVRKGSFYYFFKSKADLFLACCDSHWAEKQPMYDSVFSIRFSPVERFERLFDSIYENQKARSEEAGRVLGCPFATVGAELSTQDERIRLKVEEFGRRINQYYIATIREGQIQGSIRKDKSAEILADDLMSYTLGVLLQSRIRNSLDPIRELREGGLRVLGAESLAVA
jgi:TetR/AcrR family transcriptional repressor of nem operon